MCCFTHYEHPALGVTAENENVRCRCTCGGNCPRRATQEDMLCDICSGRRHPFSAPDPDAYITIESYDKPSYMNHIMFGPDGRQLPSRYYP